MLSGCQQTVSSPPVSPVSPRASATPTPPLRLSMPKAPARLLGKTDLSKLKGDQLTGLMQELYQRADYPAAAKAGQWAALKGGEGRYDLACCLALSGQLEAAFYYLQEAALLEGVDPVHAGQDPDLAMLRSDSRWKTVATYLQEMNRHWSAQSILKTSLVLPEKYKVGRPIGVVIGLHGLGGNQNFVDSNCQELADRLNLAFVGVSGSLPLGPKAFRWSEQPERDQQQLQKALESLHDKLTVAPGQTILFGFSQGAEMAFEIAAGHPDLYRGALCFSPGLQVDSRLPDLLAKPSAQRFLFTAGAGEHPDTLGYARRGAQWCEKSGAKVRLKIYPGMNTHSFPPDFAAQFGAWLSWVGGNS